MEYKDAKTLNEVKQIFEKFEKRNEENMKNKVVKIVYSLIFPIRQSWLLALWQRLNRAGVKT